MLWQAILFTLLYVPLRSSAGGYHAKTANRCYLYSILMMIAVLLAIKYISIPCFICIITLIISCGIILTVAPVEDLNKPLDSLEYTVYRRRTYMITAVEVIFWVIAQFCGAKQIAFCSLWVLFIMSIILTVGKCKNKFSRIYYNE